MSSKQPTVLVLGATDSAAFTLALGARSKSRLDDLVSNLDLGTAVKLHVVDTTRHDELEAVVKMATVVVNTIGPYYLWSTPVVEACVKHGVHYVDITGEIHWIKRIITSCHYAATKSGAIIVPSRGFDAMPSDIVTYIASKTLRGSSGGTVATILSDLDNVSREERRASHKEYSLSPSIGVLAPRRPLVHRLFVPDTSKTLIGSLFFMTQPDRLIVQRSWGLFEVEAAQDKSSVRYGPTFKYDEFLITGSALSAVLLTLSLVIGLRCMLIPPLRWLFKKFLPQPGEGPSESVQNNGFMELTNITTAVPSSPGAAPLQVKSLMNGQGDPGYKLTALFLSEAALCLALAHDALPAIGRRGGVLTPATALGDVLVDRLAATRQVTFESKIVTARTREGKKIV